MPEQSETIQPGGNPKAQKTTTFEGPRVVVDEKRSHKERFIPSGIDEHELYAGTQLRRWERYQPPVIRKGLSDIGVNSIEDVDGVAGDEEKLRKVASYLQTCLVNGPRRAGAVQIFRKGRRGLTKMIDELTSAEIISAFKKAAAEFKLFEK